MSAPGPAAFTATLNGADVEPRPPGDWLESATVLLRDPPTEVSWLIDGLIGDGALAAIQGYPKCGKTWILLELARALATGRPAFGVYEVRRPGPVLLVLEESPRSDTQRRLAELTRGNDHHPDDLHHLYISSNRGVRLVNDPAWTTAVRRAIEELHPVALLFDPLVRIKGTADENEQTHLAGLLGFLADLRSRHGCTVGFSHHTGHAERERMRGSSDLEAWWSSKIEVKRDDKTGSQSIRARHREAPDTPWVDIRREWDPTSHGLRLTAEGAGAPINALEIARERILALLAADDDGTGLTKNYIVERVTGARKQAIRAEFEALVTDGRITKNGARWSLAQDQLPQAVPAPDGPKPSRTPDGPDRPSRRTAENPHATRANQPSQPPDGPGRPQAVPPSPPIRGTARTGEPRTAEEPKP